MEELAALLRRERWLISVLLFRLTESRHMLAARETRFLGWAVAEADLAVERVREAELLRAATVQRLAADLGVPEEEMTLSALAEHSPDPWRQIFAEHRQAFLELIAEVQDATQANRKLAARGLHGLNDLLAMFDRQAAGAGLFDQPRRRSTDAAVPATMDRAL